MSPKDAAIPGVHAAGEEQWGANHPAARPATPTHASHLLAAGVNAKVVSERLGHSSVSFTLDVYGQVMPGQQAEAAALAASLLRL
jgi:integrase